VDSDRRFRGRFGVELLEKTVSPFVLDSDVLRVGLMVSGTLDSPDFLFNVKLEEFDGVEYIKKKKGGVMIT
jgi:hypothetical protein